MELVPISRLGAELRTQAQLEVQVTEGERQLVIVLPSSLDQLWITAGHNSGRPRLFWRRRTFLGTATDESGYLDWTADPAPLIRFVINYAYSRNQFAPQYQRVLDALRGRGLDAELAHADGGGFQIRIGLPDLTYLLIGADEILPPRPEQVQGWHVEHYGPEDHIAVVYDSMPHNRPRGASRGGAHVDVMADHVARYVASVMARYGGRHPLGAPVRLQQDATSPATVAWLLEELVRLPRHHGELANDGGALITIARRDGNDPATVELPAVVVNRISALLLAEVTACQTYGG
ncbi:hypothetical protein SHJG_7967 [Streptomyces hygroscopicus subsp. jinggangensis 5008]|nr:hypothetical protein SHJG_7967 [Streptomyces hygroscopicus subsp. jinggangensis 5008]AGF67391.1 hypothetical protein SHJGH_7729 [Streptomyces hygroscopicus subsp. jinggangensis TL01]